MVSQKVRVRDKYRWLKRFAWFLTFVIIIVAILAVSFFLGFFTNSGETVTIENPLKNLVFANTDELTGEVDREAVVEQAIMEFNAEYINYMLAAMGVNNLHSMIGYGNPIIEFVIDEDVWTSEVDNGLKTITGATSNEDLRISISREEAVNALLSSNIEEYMKQSVMNGNTQIEMIAGNVELAAKGYLGMYQEITGEEIGV
jgi:hypothetical protein